MNPNLSPENQKILEHLGPIVTMFEEAFDLRGYLVLPDGTAIRSDGTIVKASEVKCRQSDTKGISTSNGVKKTSRVKR